MGSETKGNYFSFKRTAFELWGSAHEPSGRLDSILATSFKSQGRRNKDSFVRGPHLTLYRMRQLQKVGL